jgi:hypothetical protein
MNIRKQIALLMALLLLASLFAGCSAASKSEAAMDYYATGEAPMELENGVLADGIYDSATEDKATTVTDRKLIRRISLDTETEDMDALLSAIDGKVSALGGYIENREVYTGSRYSSYEVSRNADLTVRIPKDKLDEFVAHVGSESNIISSNETSDDVTLTYVATQSRMTALQKEEARLLELIDKAANLTELLELEKRLTEVRTELESVTSQLLLYDNLVDYGTIDISIREVKQLTPVEEPGFWSRITGGFVNSLNNLWHFLKEFAIFLVAALPYLIPIAGIVLIIVFSIRHSVRKRRKAQAKRQPPFKTEEQN